MSAPSPRQFDYEAFIDELKPLIEQTESFGTADRRQDSEVFRAWRHRVSSLTTRISRTHVDSDTNLEHRQFLVLSFGSVSANEQLKAFNRDLTDTLVELNHIVEQHTKFGEPKLRPGADRKAESRATGSALRAAPSEAQLDKPAVPEWPAKEKLTLHWLFKHMPASAWVWLTLFVGGAFTLGVTVGGWPGMQKRFEPSAEPMKAAAAPARAASK